ncbi:hypothetical protein LTR02_017338 [Friedmanniomyces endolithicus]|uniref:F-box domain-containing protein n=1 Tax=Friedmanniomyces endolithicus TaxID=329885 RepID=A0A4U0UVW2_9PEZI|nr:hypothetical protein LTS09_010186 [Friedmanniomyces endolithicus]KAK0366748.1 hypothetical protein LTR94_001507 [Friedmanniomyces endolithicus]KAK0768333.1 hypothetical protein LTR59_017744 [Friedmanniomyces endolithicus]KAK0772265.1 hypothetical protein LTR38_016945 [Friedmanniomyces endolithicus]KAK0778175.1 hypothetical protein LTR75_015724 [Friedmanniomyces endolithicus]
MGATRLPLELQQQIYSHLDTRSFHAARNVCRYWRLASLDAVMLSSQLQKLPILSPPNTGKSNLQELQRVWSEAAYTLLLGTKLQRQQDLPSKMTMVQRSGFATLPWIASATNGDWTVSIDDETAKLCDTSGAQPKISTQWPLKDRNGIVGCGSWLTVTPEANQKLALSASGTLLAVACKQSVQIYDLVAGPDPFPPHSHWLVSAAGHHICGLDFEQNDRVLRVQLSGKDAVLYLGTPVMEDRIAEAGTIEDWTSKPGLRHTFLDSRLLALPGAQDATSDNTRRLSGIQLLGPFRNGFLFAAQQHGGNESSHYVLAQLRCSYTAAKHEDMHLLTADPDGVTILARLESFLSAWSYTLNGKNENGVGLWENMPSAHEHHPLFALSPDSKMLVVAERDQKVTRPVPLTQLFLYRLPGERRMIKMLEEQEREKRETWATLSRLVEKPASAAVSVGGATKGRNGYKVARIPLCLSTIRGAVTELKFERATEVSSGGLVVTACTTEAVRKWTVTEP